MKTLDILQHKRLGLWDFGVVTMVRPTGRYIQTDYGDMVEVKGCLFGTKKWVHAHLLRVVQTKETA